MKTLKLTLFIVLFLFIHKGLSAQQYINDVSSWTGLGLEYKWNKKLSLNLEGQFRTKTNLSTYDEAFGQLEIERKLPKNFSATFGFRYTFENDNVGNITGIEQHIRGHIDIKHKFDLSKLSISNRLRYQRANERFVSEREGDYTVNQLRLKTAIELNINNWKPDPRLFIEWFYKNQIGSLNGVHQYRVGLDTKVGFGKKSNLKVGYYYQHDLAFWSIDRTHIIALKYQFEADRKKNQKD